MTKAPLQQALDVLRGCLEHPDATDAIAALEAAIAQPAPQKSEFECTRSHPHENMDALCKLRTSIARLENEKAAQPIQPAPLTDIDALAKVYSSSYASPHHITFTVAGLRAMMEAAIEQSVQAKGPPIMGYLIHNEIGDTWLSKHPGPSSGNPEPLCKVSEVVKAAQPVQPAHSEGTHTPEGILKLAFQCGATKRSLSYTDREHVQIEFTQKELQAFVAVLTVAQLATCQHSIADARNPLIKSGYVCTKCGALFSAADHAQ